MTFRVSMVVLGTQLADPKRDLLTLKRDIVVNFAGCRDEEHAKQKASEIYTVKKFKSVDPIKAKK